MREVLLKGYVEMQQLIAGIAKDERGQDLIEYALVVALIAFAAVAGMNTLATNINSAFIKIGTKLTSALS